MTTDEVASKMLNLLHELAPEETNEAVSLFLIKYSKKLEDRVAESAQMLNIDKATLATFKSIMNTIYDRENSNNQSNTSTK